MNKERQATPDPAAAAEAVLRAPRVIPRPGPEYRAHARAFQGIPSLACGDEGRLWAVWYGGITPGEDRNNYVMLTMSKEQGRTWSEEILVIDPDGPGPVRAFDPQLWRSPDGRLWLFWAQGLEQQRTTSSRSGVWALAVPEAEALAGAWPVPRRLCDGVMMGKPIVLASGTWVLPVSFWHRREGGSAAVVVSDDRGTTWAERGACDVPAVAREYDEHMLVQKPDGSLWMLVRTKYGIGESLSSDQGATWSPLHPASIPHPRSRFFIRRLASGRLLLVRHAPANAAYAGLRHAGQRSHLTAFLSEDEGATWPYRLLLDERARITYPDGDQAADGTLYLVYDRERRDAREILMAALREEDLLAGQASVETRLRVLISRAGP